MKRYVSFLLLLCWESGRGCGNENWVYIRHPCRHRRRLDKSTIYHHMFFILTSISSEHFLAEKVINTNPLLFMSVPHSPEVVFTLIRYYHSFCNIKKIFISFLRKSYNLAEPYFAMEEKRTMPVCFTSDQLKLIEEYAKRRGMLNVSQAIEDLTTK